MYKQKLNKSILLVFIFILILWTMVPLVCMNEVEAAPEKTRLAFGASNTGTSLYLFCVTISEIWKRYIPGIDITVLATPGTTANYGPMERGELDLSGAWVPSDYWAMHGMYFAKTKHSQVCAMMPANKTFVQMLTYKESPIKSLKDMEGKKVHLFARATGSSLIIEEIFKTCGIKANIIFSEPQEAIGMIKDRRVDAWAYATGAPYSGFLDIAQDRPVKFISMAPEERKKVADTLPYMAADVIPAKTYPFLDFDYNTTQGTTNVNVKPETPDEIVYKLTKTAFEHWDEVVKAYPPAKWITPQLILTMVAPVHPGAVKYYKEIGIKIPDQLIFKKK